MASSEVDKAGKSKQCPRCQKIFPEGSGWLCPDDNTELVAYGPDPLVGTVFDTKYDIMSVLGQGGMSVVYKAKHKYMNRTVAIKLLREHLVTDKNAKLRFEQESKAASALSHQNIVSVHDFGFTPNGQAYFVMDCLEGESLDDVLERDGKVEVTKGIDIFKQICDGLEPAHKLGLIHRDLKPSNVVLIPQETGELLVKIVDFGIAKFTQADSNINSPRLTQTGEVFGSPIYMSPEQCQGHSLDARSDIYSLGCLMYETLTGVPPFYGDSFLNIAVQHMNAAPPSFKTADGGSNVPASVEEVVMKCLAKEPANRFQTVAEVRQALLDGALFAGLKGVRPGAVPMRESGGFKSTLDRFRITFGHTAAKPAAKQPPCSPIRATIQWTAVAALVGIACFQCFYPGPAGDRGYGVDKLHWQIDIALADKAMDSGNNDAAVARLVDAKEVTKRFGDNHAREKLTLEKLATAYGNLRMFDKQEQTNNELDGVILKMMLSDVAETRSILDKIAKRANGGDSVGAEMNQLEARANAKRVSYSSKRLHLRGMYPQEEQLLREAISTFQKLRTPGSAYAPFQIELADCLIAQQRLPEVRPLLLAALESYKEAAKSEPEGSPAHRRLVQAYLKIGIFDRDQSDFADSKKELLEALNLTEKHFAKKDRVILAYALNSYADLLRQTKDSSEYQRVANEAKTFNQALMEGRPTDMPADDSNI